MSEPEPKDDDSADALAAMAGDSDEPLQMPGPVEERDAHDALAAMAEGEDLAPAPQPEDSGENPQDADSVDDGLVAFAEDTPGEPVDPADIEGLPDREESLAVRRARAATLANQKGRVHTHQFKRTMIPLLIAVGVLLFILGGVVAAILPSGKGTSTEDAGLLMGAARWAVVAAFPLGAILLFGAWLFHRETKNTPK